MQGHYIIAEHCACRLEDMGKIYLVKAESDILKSEVLARFKKQYPEITTANEILQISEESYIDCLVLYPKKVITEE